MMTNDLSNFLSSTMIGILFVDGNLNIRKFTEYIGREYQLMEQDIGRSIQIFAHSFPYEKIVEDAQNVLKTLMPVDREVEATNGPFLHAEDCALPHYGKQHQRSGHYHHRQPQRRPPERRAGKGTGKIF